jgi:hypothetical protein
MKYMKTVLPFFLISIVVVSGGCGSYNLPTGKGYTQLCQSYVGHDRNDLINQWGPPGRVYDTSDKGEVLVYVETRDEYTLNPLAHSALIEYPPRIDPRKDQPDMVGDVIGRHVPSMDYCITYFEVNQDKKIVRAIWKGDCKAIERDKVK